MLRKRSKAGAPPTDPVPTAVPVASVPAGAPVNVIVVVESSRRRPRAPDDDEGHPVAKGIVGLAIMKRLTRRRKRPLRARMRKAAKQGRKRLRKATRRARKALR